VLRLSRSLSWLLQWLEPSLGESQTVRANRLVDAVNRGGFEPKSFQPIPGGDTLEFTPCRDLVVSTSELLSPPANGNLERSI
jgi:hypothetical protein